MKISIKTFRLFSMAALALVMAACSSNDDMIQQQTAQPQGKKMHFTATIEAPNSTTRTVYTPDKDANNKDIIKVAWKEGDEIALIHGGEMDVVTIGTPNPDGSAPISGTITVGANDENDETVVLAYPAAAVYSATPYGTFPFTPNQTCWDKAHDQDGTLEFIQNNIDFRMGSGKLAVSGDPATASLKESVKMPSMISIWKLTLQDNTSAALSATAVKVKADGELVAGATSTSATSTYYLCMVPSFIPAGDLVIEATVGSDTYTYTKAGGVSLETGKFYQSTVTLTKPAPAGKIVDPVVGQIIGSDGNNYDANATLPDGVTAVAKICYVGSDNGESAPYNHGLALAMSDANGGSSCKWKTSQADAGHTKQTSNTFTEESGLQYNDATHNSDTYPAFKYAIANNGTAAPTGCSSWFLASGYQWQKMAGAVGGYNNLGLQGGTNYWSSTEYDANEAWYFFPMFSSWNHVNKDVGGARVRACLAF